MKKKFLAVAMIAVMAAVSLTGCGNDSSSDSGTQAQATQPAVTQPAVTQAPVTQPAATQAAATQAAQMVSDATFARLQECYQTLTERYEYTVGMYNKGFIEPNAQLENALNLSREAIIQMGEVTQEELTETDALELYANMDSLSTALSELFGNTSFDER